MPRGVHNHHVRGPAHPRYNHYSTRARNGYQRFTAHHPTYPQQFVHRALTLQLLSEAGAQCYYPQDTAGYPYILSWEDDYDVEGDVEVVWAFESHHMDGDKTNNSVANVLLIDERLHAGHNSAGRARDTSGKWISRALAHQRAVEARERDVDGGLKVVGAPDWVTREEVAMEDNEEDWL